jgi:uncharacterized protein (DUF3820 family)
MTFCLGLPDFEEIEMPFGKYKNVFVHSLYEKDKNYLIWASKNLKINTNSYKNMKLMDAINYYAFEYEK